MELKDNVLKAYLKNVLFVSGTPCGGKTTATRRLAAKYGLPVFDIDEHFDRHRALSDPNLQPCMNRSFANADAFFGRTVEEYRSWLLGNTREQLDFVLLDLIRVSHNQPVLCDCHLTLEEAQRLTDPSRVAFLIKEPSNIIDDYCNRPDHQGFRNFLYSATDVEQAKTTANETLKSLNAQRYADIKASQYFWLERTGSSTVEHTVAQLERHFGLDALPITIHKVEKDTELSAKLIEFVENFSWVEVKEHTLQNLRDWVFTDWESMFVAMAGDRVVGMVSLFKTDYYPLPEIFPWVSSLFVTEDFRGRRISQQLVDHANAYALSLGFDRTYIPSEHVGLYEKYGYRYVKDIVNYGGDTDRLYVKELK